jgi:SH3 domain
MYDFADFSDVDKVLSFEKGEILDIIECRDDLGWWAAVRTEGSKVGWISKSYVQRLSKEMAERLRRIPQIVRVHEYNAEQLYNSPVVPRVNRRR